MTSLNKLQGTFVAALATSIAAFSQEPARAPYTPPSSSTSPKVASTPLAPKTPKEEREAAIAADTQKLYQLAEELKAEVAKSNKDTLSLSVIRKAEEIEKLARSLRERMKKE